MLDFYLLDDNFDVPEYPEEYKLEYVGGLDLKVYYNLQKKGIIDDEFSFFSDFRWDKQTIQTLLQRTKEPKFERDTNVKLLVGILHKAIQKNSGLVTYCD